MMKIRYGQLFAGLHCLFLLMANPLFAKPLDGSPEQSDVRVLIDISGSMKQNDPQNLRRSALRMLVGLLPEGSRAGVWTFGQYVNMEIPLSKVDKAWKKRARARAGKIHSRGLYTNIEGVLARSSKDWDKRTGKYRRDMILLSDGMVDISKDPTKNAASRARILDHVIPRLKTLGVKVHTIALSERADTELLRTLAEATDGWYEQVENSDRLQRVFLRMFEKVGKPDSLPLKDNTFTVDKHVQELTLLVFRPKDAAPTRVEPPGGEAFDVGSAPMLVTWHRDEGYDLLTIEHPQPGQWRVQAQTDPDNRVMVVTDLKMLTTDLPNRLTLGQAIPLVTSFTNRGHHIKSKSFLDVMQVTSEQRNNDEVSLPQPLKDDGTGPDQSAGDGYFTRVIGQDFKTGKGELIVTTKGKTFVREKRQAVEILSPVVLEVKTVPDDAGAEIMITPVAGLMNPLSLDVKIELAGADGGRLRPLNVTQGDGGVWQVRLDLSSLAGEHSLQVAVSGTTPDGQKLSTVLDPVPIQGQLARITGESEQAPGLASAEAVGESQEDTEVKSTGSGWVFNAIVLGIINLVVLSLAGTAFWYIRRTKKNDKVQLLDNAESAA